MTQILQTLTFNAGGTAVEETIDGRVYLVTNGVMLTEGVHEGTSGKLYYPDEELAKNPSKWDKIPITSGHPRDGTTLLTANNNKPVLDQFGLGFIDGTSYSDKKLRTRLYFDKEKTQQVEPRIVLALNAGAPFEGSTGVLLDIEDKKGTFNGVPFTGVARNYNGDHYAALMDTKGACDLKKGCGCNVANEATVQPFVLNDASYQRIARNIQTAMETRGWYSVYVRDVYNGFFVYGRDSYRTDGTYYKQEYSVNKDGEVTLSEKPPEELKYVQEYRTKKDNKYVGNCSPEPKEPEVDKKTRINQLITNGSWTEADRPWLEALPDDKLNRLPDRVPTPAPSPVQTNNQTPVVQTPAPSPVVPQVPTFNQEDLEILAEAKAARAQEKASLIAVINQATSSKPTSFAPGYLEGLSVPVLRTMASIATPSGQVVMNGGNFTGMAPAVIHNVHTAHVEPPMIPVKMEFTK